MSRRTRWILGVVLGAVLVGVGVVVGVLLAGRGGSGADAPTAAATGDGPGATASPGATSDAPEEPGEPDVPGGPDGISVCMARYVVRDSWADGFTVDVTVDNHGPAREGWEVAWRFAGEERVGNLWDAVLVSPPAGEGGRRVVVRDAGYNATLASEGSVTFGFVGVGASAGVPEVIELDGQTCGTGEGSPLAGASAASPTPSAAAGEAASASSSAAAPKPSASAPKPSGTAPKPSAASPKPSASAPKPTAAAPSAAAGAFYVDRTSQAAAAAAAASGTERALLEKIAGTSQGFWVTGSDAAAAAASVRDYTRRAQADGTAGVLVVYAVPGRDCGQHSSGGVAGSAYARWVDAVADAVVGKPWVVLEPDALAMLGDCDGQGDRVGYLAYAAKSLTRAGARVYVDVGHSGWLAAEEAARRLKLVGLDDVAGFAVNVSNYQSTKDSVAYGQQVSRLTGGARFVVDTSRNGNGSDGQWCNPPGRALGERPRLVDDGTALDALLWVKRPGESDGACNGGPGAGQWFGSMALELARNARW